MINIIKKGQLIKSIIIVIIFIQKDDQGKTMARVSRALSSETK